MARFSFATAGIRSLHSTKSFGLSEHKALLHFANHSLAQRSVKYVRCPIKSKDAWIGAGIGAGAGAIAAASRSRTSRGAYAFFGALGGAFFGYLVGLAVPLFHLRGKVIYKR